MSDLKKYVTNRKKKDPAFALEYDSGYSDFKIGALLKQAREESGYTQEEIARKLHTKKSAISRIENHSEDMRISTLKKFAHSVGRQLVIKVA